VAADPLPPITPARRPSTANDAAPAPASAPAKPLPSVQPPAPVTVTPAPAKAPAVVTASKPAVETKAKAPAAAPVETRSRPPPISAAAADLKATPAMVRTAGVGGSALSATGSVVIASSVEAARRHAQALALIDDCSRTIESLYDAERKELADLQRRIKVLAQMLQLELSA
jgi:hypothetical protein